MPSLATLPAEVLDAIVQQLVAISYDYEKKAFGETLQRLALVNRRLNAACEPYRFKDWELVFERREGRLAQHLSRPSFAKHVQYLAVPVYHGRAASRKKSQTQDNAYDALLAQVVASAVCLKQITLFFNNDLESSYSERREQERIFLPGTLQACIDHKEVKRLRCLSVSDLKACEEACRAIRTWSSLTSIDILQGTDTLDFTEEKEIVRALLEAVSQRDDLRELTYHLPSFNNLLPTDAVSEPSPSRQGLSKLKIVCLDSFRMDSWTTLVHQSIRTNPNLSDLDIHLYLLHLAVTQIKEESLDLSRIKVLRLDTESVPHFKLKIDDVYDTLHAHTGLFTESSALSSLCLTGPRSVELIESVLAKPHILSLRRITGTFLIKRYTKKRLRALFEHCEAHGVDLCLEGYHSW